MDHIFHKILQKLENEIRDVEVEVKNSISLAELSISLTIDGYDIFNGNHPRTRGIK